MISIVVPARNENGVIARTLAAMVTGAAQGEVEVVVICNGCTDRTAEIARGFGPPIRVIETRIGNKSRALNLGDQAASSFPRMYVDADVVITLAAVRALAARLEHGDVLAVAPQADINCDGASWCVRAYYDMRSRLPSAREGIGGSGVYAVSEAGRQRFGQFPDLIADDGYMRIQFRAHERQTLADVNSTVFAPRTVKDLIRIRTRAYLGTIELARRYPDLWQNRGDRNHKTILGLLWSPLLWPKLAAYCYVNIIARYRALCRLNASSLSWERDNTSRNPVRGVSDLPEDQRL
jgi:glycosyltransferase involved in cell wall biosynthesis